MTANPRRIRPVALLGEALAHKALGHLDIARELARAAVEQATAESVGDGRLLEQRARQEGLL